MSLSTRSSALLIPVFAVLAIPISLGAETVSERWEQSFRLPPTAEVIVVNPDGDVTVEISEGPEVRIRAEKTARAESKESARRLLRDLDLRIQRSPESLEIRAVPVQTGGWLDWVGGEVRGRTDLRLDLPTGSIDLRIKSDNGDIEVRFAGRSARLETTNGRISVRAVGSGQLEATTVNGDIVLDLESVPETARVDLSAVNGDVRVVTPENLRASIDARSVNGCVGTSLDLAEGHRTRSKLIGALNGGGGQIRVRTTNGRVWVKKD